MAFAEQDLSFLPVANPTPTTLSTEDIARYNREGFCQPFQIFDTDEIQAVRHYVDSLMDAAGESGSYGINCYQARLKGLYDIATHPRILDCVEDIIGPNILCWASHILSKKPHDPKRVPWHQDASFWGLSPARTVTVWLAIDDADEQNSAMRFIPGTHTMGSLETSSRDDSSLFHKGTANPEQFGKPFTNSLKAGQISLHADMLVHGSKANASERRRCGFTLRYCPPEVQIVDADWERGVEAILCRGESGHWRTHPMPTNDDITQTRSPIVLGNN